MGTEGLWIPMTVMAVSALASATASGVSMYQSGQEAKKAKGAQADEAKRRQEEAAAAQAEREAGKMSAAKKMFRQGIFNTSPTGLTQGSRGRSRLMGA